MRSNLVDLTVQLVHETAAAWLVTDGDVRVWVPKSACELAKDPGAKCTTYTPTLSEQLATEKGLV